MTDVILKCPHCYNEHTFTVKTPKEKKNEWTHLFICPGCKEMFQATITKLKRINKKWKK